MDKPDTTTTRNIVNWFRCNRVGSVCVNLFFVGIECRIKRMGLKCLGKDIVVCFLGGHIVVCYADGLC